MTNTSLSEGPIYCGVDSVCLGRYKISVRQSFPPAFNPIFSYMSLFLTPCPAKKIQSTQIIAVLLCHGAQSIVYWKFLLPGNKFRGLPRSFIEKESSTFANKYCIWENGFLQNQIRDFTLGAEENNNQWPHTNTRLRQKH